MGPRPQALQTSLGSESSKRGPIVPLRARQIEGAEVDIDWLPLAIPPLPRGFTESQVAIVVGGS